MPREMRAGKAYYNEFDPYAAQWLRNLIQAGLIPAGDVDDRSIREVQPEDLRGYAQCHFFAGIAGWSLALELAGWPATRPVWTGSCPCQPFSAAGKRKGADDPRHLWPDFLRLITACNPPTVFGEQVASKDGRVWLAGVRTDLEALAYDFGAADLCAAGVGAPHIRQRLFWVADADGWNASAERQQRSGQQRQFAADGSPADGVEHAASDGRKQRWPEPSRRGAERGCGDGGLAHTEDTDRLSELATSAAGRGRCGPSGSSWLGDAERERIRVPGCGPDECAPRGMQDADRQRERLRSNPWAASELVFCADGETRRIEPGTFPLAHGVSNRVGKLRAYGNAIVPPLAAEFIASLPAHSAA